MPISAPAKRIAIFGLAASMSLTVFPAAVRAAGPGCATPGRDGTASITGVVNTYYPGAATAAADATTITLGTATGSSTPIAAGDLVLVIQMQDAAIDSTNTSSYGDGIAGDPATGSTALNASGLYEYAVATSAVPLGGGSLTIGSGLINMYTQAAPSATQGQRDFQVIRVPQYITATLTAGLTAGSFNGSTGGGLVFDVNGALNLNGTAVSVSQEGFRAGLGRPLAGAAGGGPTDYVNLSANPYHAQKGEGIAGTPQYLYNSLTGGTVNNGVDGYPNGSTARGAPATAGGGGTDPAPTNNSQNTGGGGGANGGAGGQGGNSWSSNLALGGFGGTSFPASAARVTAGAGGGAGTRNNSPLIANASSGGNGGGIVMIRAGSVTGTGSITADGGTGVAPLNDGGGGGGAGGSVVVAARSGALAGLTINARGGAGSDAWPTSAGGAPSYHGPGGGGGGGVVLTTSAAIINVNGGVNGTTTTGLAAYGATPGGTGTQATILASQVPGAGSGASCASDLTIAKTHTDPLVPGSTGIYTLTASNVGGTASSGTTTVTDILPAGLAPMAAVGTGWTCGIVGQTVTCTSTASIAGNGSFPAISLTVAVAQSATSSLTNTATVSGGGEVNTTNDSASDATTMVSQADVAVTKTASSGMVAVGSNVAFTVTATNNGPSDASGVQVTDQLPTGLTYASSTPSAGTYTSGTGVWDIGTLANGGSATLALTATMTATGSVTNTASKTAETEIDPNAGNNSASVTVTGPASDLTIAKTHGAAFVRGSTGSYSLTVTNIGMQASSGTVTVSDTVPAGLTPTSASGTGWTCGIAAQTVTCTRLDALAASAAYPMITVTVSVLQSAAGAVTNGATVAGGAELNTANDSATDPTSITSRADVGLTKSASSGTVVIGSTVTYLLTAHNAGPSDATGVQITDQLPAGLTFVSATPAAGTYTASTGVWNIGSLVNGATTSLALTATVSATGTITNTAVKSAETESDTNLANNSASAAISAQPTAGIPGPPNGGMAPAVKQANSLGGGPIILVGLAIFLVLLVLRRISLRVAALGAVIALATLPTLVGPALTARSTAAHVSKPAVPSDVQLFGKAISTVKPKLVTLATLQPAKGPITPNHIRIPSLGVDTRVESVGVTAKGLMDVPGNIWNAAWLRTGVKPGALGQAVIDGHLDSATGPAVFIDLHRLRPGDRIYVSDASGHELSFKVTAVEVAPLNGFPSLRVFGPAKGRLLNLITCAGHFDAKKRTYDHRLVVFTTLAS
jgi:uncharacterized repeat protein (TIGR01451 family)